ncbi:hypothetical protein KBX50_02995 [Micromonospora sp. C51]|uniref:hypothetical protein n=1 Tax=Micromonospora sp. C51 TaxID=2824879 RepID=UPI001B39220C|nr:hypothetical protein [Micromonospora sp. C51]MBQ1047454.1 hypothetical protein [Micromonospora sp. C51]
MVSGTDRVAAERGRWSGILLVERLVTPPPPRLVAIEVEKKLRNLLAIRVPKRHGVPDSFIRVLPGLDILIDAIEQPQLLGEQRPKLRQAFPRVDASVQPREVATVHHELSKYPAAVASVQRPGTTVTINHDHHISDRRSVSADLPGFDTVTPPASKCTLLPRAARYPGSAEPARVPSGRADVGTRDHDGMADDRYGFRLCGESVIARYRAVASHVSA